MASVFDHLHIKRHTAGSSNELSLDVLDAARSGLDAKADKSARMPKVPKPSQGSYHGVMGTATFSSQAEVKKRKKDRRVRSLLAGTVGVLLAVAASFALLWAGYQHYLGVQDFSTRFDALVNQFAEEDAYLSEVDVQMSLIPGASKTEQMAQLQEEAAEQAEGLNRIRQNAVHARPLATDERDKQVLSELIEGTEERLVMLEEAQEAFHLVEERDKRIAEVDTLWEEVLKQSQASLDVAASANEASTEKELNEARDKTREVRENMQETLDHLKEEAAAAPEIDLELQAAYLEAKIESLDLAVQTSEALIAGQREEAAARNEAYNTKDHEAASLAKELPLSLGQTCEYAYKEPLDEAKRRYEEARTQALAHDSHISDYLASR